MSRSRLFFKFCIATLLVNRYSSFKYNLPTRRNDIGLKISQEAFGRSKYLSYKRSMTSLTQTSSTSTIEKPKIIEPFGKGIVNDFKTKVPFYKSDFKDGFNIKSLASTFFLFFACLSPAIAFGGLLTVATRGAMGTMEAVGATAIGGVLYALFSGQPLTIIGTTGPLLAFLKVLYEACASRGLPFLPVYAWVGLWSSLFLYISAFFSISNLVEYFTKFTDDIFSTLISVIFIFEGFKELYLAFANPAISGLQATCTCIVALTTLTVARTLSSLRGSKLLPRKVRNLLVDFAPSLGVLSGISVAKVLTNRYTSSALKLPTLAVPAVLGTTSGRPWLVDIFSLPNHIKLLTLIPALMATVLLFMDQNITVRLIMSKENKLKKGNGIHLDMLIVAIVTTITSLLGMPWMVAATVRSLAHLRSLAEYALTGASTTPATAETSKNTEDTATATATTAPTPTVVGAPKLTGVMEQRLSGLNIHLLIGGSILFCRPLLRQIPVSALTGLFLYLGISSISKTDLFERSKLLVSDSKDITGSPWSIKDDLMPAKLFTSIQLLLLGAMWWLKETKLGVLFPVLIGLLAPVRIALEKYNIFKSDELAVLDGEIA